MRKIISIVSFLFIIVINSLFVIHASNENMARPYLLYKSNDFSEPLIKSQVYYEVNGEPTDAINLKLLMINGNFVPNVSIITEDSRTLVPIRIVSESLGANVFWDADSFEAKIVANDTELVIQPEINEAIVNGNTVNLEVPPKIVNEIIYVPLRFVAENLKCNVGYKDDFFKSIDGYLPVVWIERKFDLPNEKNKSEAEFILKEHLYDEMKKNSFIANMISEEEKEYASSETREFLEKTIESVEVIDGFGRFYIVQSTHYSRHINDQNVTVRGIAYSDVLIDKYYGTIFEIKNLASTSIVWEILQNEECDILMSFFVG